jgi:CelD/BcsL family acetyltransferase involved in cellulose biosynthesis
MSAAAFTLVEPSTPPPGQRRPATVTELRPTAAQSTRYDLITTRAGFDSLDADWNALFERAGRGEQMFIGYNWLWHWANTYLGHEDHLAIVTARRNGRLILIMPLVVERVAKLTQLAFMGAPVSQYGDILIDDIPDAQSVIESAWSHLRERQSFDLVRLAKVRADAAIAPFLAGFGFTVTAEEEAPFADLAACKTYGDFEARSSAKLRKNRRRQLRRLEERGPLEVRWLTGNEEARDAVRLTMTIKRAWLNHKALVSKAFKDQRIDTFFANAIASTERPCGVQLSLLKSNGEGCDANVSITCKGRRAVHILAYSLKFEKLGVGNHHLDVNLERAFHDGIAVYDFLAPKHIYKMEMADGTVPVRDHTLAISPLGRLYVDLYVAWLREGLKRTVARLPVSLRRLLAGRHTTVE